MPRLSHLAPASVAALACLAAAAPAMAGSYTVRQCDYAAGNGHHDFQWQAAGVPTVDPHAGSGCGEFGLAVRNGGGGTQRTYPSGAYGGWFAYAPNGTVITSFSGAFGVLEGSCCVSGMASYAEATQTHDGQGLRAYLFQGHLGNDSWYAPSGLQGPVGRGWSSSTSGFDAKRVGFHLRCGPGFSCSQGIYGDLRLRGRSFDFTLRDDAAPSVGDPVGTLTTGGWVRGLRTLAFPAHDAGGGLATVEAAFDTGVVLGSPSGCTVVAGRYARLQPCPSARTGDWTVDTSHLPDGGRHLHLRATDAGGATTTRTVAAYVDNGAPQAPRDVSVAGGEGWRAENDFELAWTNPGGQHAPIALARWRACRVDAPPAASECVNGARSAADVTTSGPIVVPGAGEWEVRAWLTDAVGNGDPATASDPRRLRFDPDPPEIRILPEEAGVPARFVVAVSDLSGLAGGSIELRRQGTDGWVELATQLSAGTLTGELETSRPLAGGVYDVRVRAVDAAGNRTEAHGVRAFADPVPPPFDLSRLDHLLLGQGEPLSWAPRPIVHGPARVTMTARVRTARHSATRRRAIRRGRRPAWRDVRRLTIPGGRPVRFHGRVGRPVPRAGKLVEVQAHFRGRWRTISVVRSRRGGRWRFAYRFRAATRRATYTLRARAPVEAGYPFSAGVSRPVRVTVLAARR
ncbi:MAG TPA: hypothetical protein VHF90_01685 [Thermoleophilaceae bacterium]|nr:hypothetical protein [Thermoleophilaceae bacterium]